MPYLDGVPTPTLNDSQDHFTELFGTKRGSDRPEEEVPEVDEETSAVPTPSPPAPAITGRKRSGGILGHNHPRAIILTAVIAILGIGAGVLTATSEQASEHAGELRVTSDSATISKMCGPRALLAYQVTMRQYGNVSVEDADGEMTKILEGSVCK